MGPCTAFEDVARVLDDAAVHAVASMIPDNIKNDPRPGGNTQVHTDGSPAHMASDGSISRRCARQPDPKPQPRDEGVRRDVMLARTLKSLQERPHKSRTWVEHGGEWALCELTLRTGWTDNLAEAS